MTSYRDGIGYDRARGLWRVRVCRAGRIYKASARSKEEAERIRDLLRYGRGSIEESWTLSTAAAQWISRLLAIGRSPETIRYYDAKLAALFRGLGDRLLTSITDADISAYVRARREAGASGRTIREELAILARVYRAVRVPLPWVMPRIRIEERYRRVPQPEEVARLWLALGQHPARAALGLCLLAGLRASEAMRARAEWYDRERQVLVLPGRATKTGRSRELPVVATLAALIPDRGPIVQASELAVRDAFRRASAKAGLPEWSGPGLGRHAFATWCVAFGGRVLEQVADALGHSRPGLPTARYVHAVALQPMLRPMAELVERLLLDAIAAVQEGGHDIPVPNLYPAANR